MSDQDVSNLYMLIFPKVNAYKIGKADDIQKRLVQLRRFWGDPDYSESYRLQLPSGAARHVEKGLHHMLHEHEASPGSGDGHTELFAMESLQSALDLVELYLSRAAYNFKIIKGINEISSAKPAAKGKRRTRTAEEEAEFLSKCGDRMKRLVMILKRRQHRIPYEWHFDESNDVVFRVFLPLTRKTTDAIMNIFLLRSKIYGISLCNKVYCDENLREFHLSACGGGVSEAVDAIVSELLAILAELPARSEARARLSRP